MNRIFLILFTLFYSLPSHAHVKWFVADAGTFSDAHFSVDPITLSIFIGAFLYISFGSWLQWSARKPGVIQTFLFSHWTKVNLSLLLKSSLFILLLGNILQGHFIAPNIPVSQSFRLESFLQALLIVVLVVDAELFSASLLLLAASLFYFYGWEIAVDYFFELSAIAIAIFASADSGFISKKLGFNKITIAKNGFGLNALRIGLGFQLCVLSLHDKLLNPGLSLHFLSDYPYFNFMKIIGFPQFSDLHFVFSAGLAEFSFGLLLIANIAQRMAAITILFFFSLTGVILGPAELLGHIPIMVVVLILLLQPAPRISFHRINTGFARASTISK